MRKKVLNLAMIFGGVMLALTILSNLFNKMTIVNVSTEEAEAVNIYHEITTGARVEVTGEEPVFTEPELRVSAVNVSEGQVVKANEVLFQVDETNLADKIKKTEQEIYKIDLQIQQAKERQREETEKFNQTFYNAKESYTVTVEEGNLAVAQAKGAFEEAKRRYEQFLNDGTNAEQKEEEERLLADIREKCNAYDSAIMQSERNEVAARQALEQAGISPAADNSTAQLEVDRSALADQAEKLKQFQSGQGKVVAPFDAVIVKVNIVTGELTGTNAPVLLANASSAMLVNCYFTEEEMKVIDEETEMIVTGTGKDGEEKRIEGLRPGAIAGKEGQPELTQVTVSLPADTFAVGAGVGVTARRQAKSYEMGIPLKALHQEDKDTYYVYVAEKKKTFLGEQTEAKRVDVKVLEKDTRYAAIEYNAYLKDRAVVTEADKTMNEGSRIRLLKI